MKFGQRTNFYQITPPDLHLPSGTSVFIMTANEDIKQGLVNFFSQQWTHEDINVFISDDSNLPWIYSVVNFTKMIILDMDLPLSPYMAGKLVKTPDVFLLNASAHPSYDFIRIDHQCFDDIDSFVDHIRHFRGI